MATNPPAGTPRILARLAYEDVEGGIAFLGRAFGFRERPGTRLESGDGKVFLTEMDVIDSRIVVSRVGGHDLKSPKTLGGITGILVVYVDGIDQHYAVAKAAGAEIVGEIADMPWGDRRYEALDSEGHRWAFHQHLRDVSAEELRRAL